MIDKNYIKTLLDSYLAGDQVDQDELSAVIQNPANTALIKSLLEEKMEAEYDMQYASRRFDPIFSKVIAIDKNAASESIPRIHFLRTTWFRYAAAIIIIAAAAGWYFLANNASRSTTSPPIVVQTDIPPGREGAVLTLGDGRQITLDSAGNGLLLEQEGTKVLLENGRLAYNASNAAAVTYNTMTTPKGRQFSIQLPDGSRAWLNAASSITYPTAFISEERAVKITGEVYLEIVKDSKKPFKVKIDDKTEINVLGTSFNIRAYNDDLSITTTLLEGAVSINAYNRLQTLKPGQQVKVKSDGAIELVKNPDIDKVMAWKNGVFNFQDAPLEEVMKQLERWYDIEVKYVGNPPKREFIGEMHRDLSLMQVIESLREVGLRFKVEGRTLIVSEY